jgi:hypothetical protein
LAYTVVDGDGEPLFNSAQWEAFGAQHTDVALRLWDEAWQVSGLAANDDDAKKNSPAPSSNSP